MNNVLISRKDEDEFSKTIQYNKIFINFIKILLYLQKCKFKIFDSMLKVLRE